MLKSGLAHSTRVRRMRARSAILLGVCVAVILVVVQLVLPSIAADRLRSSLERNGQDVRVSVSAFPAEELLFGEADSVNVRIGKLVARSQHVGNLLARTANVGSLDARVNQFETNGLTLTHVVLRKQGDSLLASANVSNQAIRKALPFDLTLADAPPGSSGLVIHANVPLFDHSVGAEVGVAAEGGKIVLHPLLPGIAAVLDGLNLTLFSNPAVAVDRVWSISTGSGYTLRASAQYR